MKIEFEYTEEDWIAYNLYYAKNDKQIKKMKKRMGVIFPILFIVLATLFLFGKEPNYFMAIMFYVFSILYVFIGKRMTGKGYEKRIKPMLSKFDNSGIIGNHIIVLEDEYIHEIIENSESKINWKGIKAIEENEKYYFLFLNSLYAIVIPKYAIEDLYQFDNFIKERSNHS